MAAPPRSEALAHPRRSTAPPSTETPPTSTRRPPRARNVTLRKPHCPTELPRRGSESDSLPLTQPIYLDRPLPDRLVHAPGHRRRASGAAPLPSCRRETLLTMGG